MRIRDCCPQCGSTHHKKNGHIHNGKQSYCCKACGRQFVWLFDQRLISAEQRALIGRLLRERLSLHGICRAVGVSKKARKTNRVERFNCTLRQRVSRLVRSALSFSKKLTNHIGAIRYFLGHYNLELAGA